MRDRVVRKNTQKMVPKRGVQIKFFDLVGMFAYLVGLFKFL